MIDTRPKFLVIRPKDRWDRTRDVLEPQGVSLIFTDVLTYIPTHTPLIPLTGVKGVIITSLRAATSLKDIPMALYAMPLFIVGVETAKQLKDQGFTGHQTIAPTAEDLVPLINTASDTRQTYLYLRGSDVALQFHKVIKSHIILEHISYRGLPKSGLSDEVMGHLRTEHIKGILFFSRESTRAFWDMAERSDLIPYFSKLTALCLSPAVLGCLHPKFFNQTMMAPTPDLAGMGQALCLYLQKTQEDTSMPENAPTPVDSDLSLNMIANADAIIERFGGIRPMANKLGVPVTTVQGWKKRGVIPANRAALIEQSAQTHGLETTGLIHIVSGDTTTRITMPRLMKELKKEILSEAPLQIIENVDLKNSDDIIPHSIDQKEITDQNKIIPSDLEKEIQKLLNETGSSDDLNPDSTRSNIDIKTPLPTSLLSPDSNSPQDSKKTANPDPMITAQSPLLPSFNRRKIDKIARATWLAVILLATAIIIGLIAMTPGISLIKNQDARLKSLATDIDHMNAELSALRNENALLSGLVPRDLKDQIDLIQNRAKNIEKTVVDLGTETKALTQGVMGSEPQSIEGRLSQVETKLGDVTKTFASEHLAQFVMHLNRIRSEPNGRDTIETMVRTLYGALPVDITPAEFDKVLSNTVRSTPDFLPLLNGFSNIELHQALLILVLTHMRDAMTGDRVAFTQDIQLLNLMMPDQKKILSPFDDLSKEGIRSVDGLKSDFQVMSENVKTALLKDKTMSWTTQILAYLHERIRIERNGIALTGTKTQHILDQAAQDLAQQNIAGSVLALQTLNGAQAAKAMAWIKDAEARILATKAMDDLTKTISVMISLDPSTTNLIEGLSPKSNLNDMTNGVAKSLGSRS